MVGLEAERILGLTLARLPVRERRMEGRGGKESKGRRCLGLSQKTENTSIFLTKTFKSQTILVVWCGEYSIFLFFIFNQNFKRQGRRFLRDQISFSHRLALFRAPAE